MKFDEALDNTPKFEPAVSKAERYELGKALRKQCPHEDHRFFEEFEDAG